MLRAPSQSQSSGKAVPERRALLSQICQRSFSILSFGNGRVSVAARTNGPGEQHPPCHLSVKSDFCVEGLPSTSLPRTPTAPSFRPLQASFPHLISVSPHTSLIVSLVTLAQSTWLWTGVVLSLLVT